SRRRHTSFSRDWSSAVCSSDLFASEEQARHIVGHIRDEGTFNSPYGIRSLSKDEKMYSVSATINPSNWLGPIWVIVNYVVFRGLDRKSGVSGKGPGPGLRLSPS